MYSCLSALVTLSIALTLVQGKVFVLEKGPQVVRGGSTNKDATGLVFGARSCGGEGKYIQSRIDVCNTTDSVCQYPADGKVRSVEVTFIPSQNVEQLALQFITSINGSEPQTDEDTLEDSTVQSGIEQTVSIFGYIPEEFKGSKLYAKIILSRVVDSVVETCVEADFDLV